MAIPLGAGQPCQGWALSGNSGRFSACVLWVCVWRVELSAGPRELKMPTAREEATAMARLFLELLLALDDFMERLARVL